MNYLAILRPLLEKHEGFLSTPVWDVKQWSIGYGTAVGFDPSNKPQVRYTRSMAWDQSLKNIRYHYGELKKVVKTALNPHQWAALISFSYNTGIGNGRTMAGYVNTGNRELISQKWLKYVYAGGKRLEGLMKRRNEELALFYSAGSPGMPPIGPVITVLLLITSYFLLR